MSMDDKVVTLEDLKAAQMLSVKPDWEQDDPTAPDYIKNKPESELPAVTSSDEGKFLRVSSTGEWVVESVSPVESETWHLVAGRGGGDTP